MKHCPLMYPGIFCLYKVMSINVYICEFMSIKWHKCIYIYICMKWCPLHQCIYIHIYLYEVVSSPSMYICESIRSLRRSLFALIRLIGARSDQIRSKPQSSRYYGFGRSTRVMGIICAALSPQSPLRQYCPPTYPSL